MWARGSISWYQQPILPPYLIQTPTQINEHNSRQRATTHQRAREMLNQSLPEASQSASTSNHIVDDKYEENSSPGNEMGMPFALEPGVGLAVSCVPPGVLRIPERCPWVAEVLWEAEFGETFENSDESQNISKLNPALYWRAGQCNGVSVAADAGEHESSLKPNEASLSSRIPGVINRTDVYRIAPCSSLFYSFTSLHWNGSQGH